MRNLTTKQKKVIDKMMANNPEIRFWNDLTLETMDELEKINDTEILPQEVNRYINNKYY